MSQWGNWMLEGMLLNPKTLNLNNDDVNSTLSKVLCKIRDLKHQFKLKREELGLEVLFNKLNDELSRSVAEINHENAMIQRNLMALEHVVRSIHLSLVVSAILEDESQLQTIISIIKTNLFDLKDKPQFRVLSKERMDFTVNTYVLLHDDLSKCLYEIINSRTRRASLELKNITRRFYLNYHHQIQLGLLYTEGFLRALENNDINKYTFERQILGTEHDWIRLNNEEVRSSFINFIKVLNNTDYLNSEIEIVNLIKQYRKRIGFSFWKNPSECGLNCNMNLMVLMCLLKSETPPDFSKIDTNNLNKSDWPRPSLIMVIDHYINSLEKNDSELLIKRVTYDSRNFTPKRSTVEYHPRQLFSQFTERLLRAQEIASFPFIVQNVIVDCDEHINSILQSILLNNELELTSLDISGRKQERTRHLDGKRRHRLIMALQNNIEDGSGLVRLAHFATLLPNDPCNANDPKQIETYDLCRALIFDKMCEALDRWSDAESETMADALIAGLRLEFSQRDRKPNIPGRSLMERFHSRLSDSGRKRILMEILLQAEETHTKESIRLGCSKHKEKTEVTCPDCRESLALVLKDRVQGLVDVRRICCQELHQQFEGPPRTKLEVIGQLTRSMQRLRDASRFIQKIDEDTVKAAFRLLKQLKRAYAVIPAHWRPEEIKQAIKSPDDSLAAMLIGLERMGVSMYSEFLPFHGDFDTKAILGNPDALVVFSLFDADMKNYLLKSMPLTEAMEDRMQKLQAPIGTPETAELLLVHSIVQPLLATGVWEEGHHAIDHGQSLIEFVVKGKTYDESFFDRDLAYVVTSEFKLSPKKLFEEAFQGIDIAAKASRQHEEEKWDSDAFIYEVWFGDLRAALREQGESPREHFNLDRFIQRAATIPRGQALL